MLSSFAENPQKMAFEGEDHNEKILYVLRRAFITNIGWLTAAIALFFIPIAINALLLRYNINNPGAIRPGFVLVINSFWYLFVFGFIFERFLNWFFNVYLITNQRVIDMDYTHLLNREISEAPLRNIEDITHTVMGTFSTIFNIGNVSIQTAGERREIEFELIARPAKVQDILSDLVSEVKGYYAK